VDTSTAQVLPLIDRWKDLHLDDVYPLSPLK